MRASVHRAGRLVLRFAGGAGGAITAQAVTAGGSFLLQVIAVRALGDAGYGRYALCFAVLITVTAVQTGWVGDSLTVLDRHSPELRAALATCLVASVVLGLLGGIVAGFALGLGGWRTAVLFGVLLAAWLLAEAGRRLLMARLEFWKLVVNDLTYLAVTLAVLVGCHAAGAEPTLGMFLGAMAVGAAAAVLLAFLQVPGTELADLRPGWRGMGALAAFAAWRSGQAALRPGALLAARLLVLHLASAAALGRLETARLLMAPAQTVINGAGAFLLPAFARAERERPTSRVARRLSRRRADRAAMLLVAVTLVTGLVVLALLDPLTELVTGGQYEVSAVAVLGWTVFLATSAASLPYVSETVARRLSREVFKARLVDSALGVCLTAMVLTAEPGAVSAVPWLLSVGGVVGAIMLCRLAHRSRSRDQVIEAPVGGAQPASSRPGGA